MQRVLNLVILPISFQPSYKTPLSEDLYDPSPPPPPKHHRLKFSTTVSSYIPQLHQTPHRPRILGRIGVVTFELNRQ